MTLWDRFPRKKGWEKDPNNEASSPEYIRDGDSLADTWCCRKNEMVIVDVHNSRGKLIDTTSREGTPRISDQTLSTIGRGMKKGRKRYIFINPR